MRYQPRSRKDLKNFCIGYLSGVLGCQTIFVISERVAERKAADDVPGSIVSGAPFTIVCGGGFAHIAVKPVVAIGDVCGKGQPIRDGIFEVDAKSCIHETFMVKTFDFLEFGEISFRAK